MRVLVAFHAAPACARCDSSTRSSRAPPLGCAARWVRLGGRVLCVRAGTYAPRCVPRQRRSSMRASSGCPTWCAPTGRSTTLTQTCWRGCNRCVHHKHVQRKCPWCRVCAHHMWRAWLCVHLRPHVRVPCVLVSWIVLCSPRCLHHAHHDPSGAAPVSSRNVLQHAVYTAHAVSNGCRLGNERSGTKVLRRGVGPPINTASAVLKSLQALGVGTDANVPVHWAHSVNVAKC